MKVSLKRLLPQNLEIVSQKLFTSIVLSEEVVVYVVNKFLFELEDVLEQKNVSLIISDAARKWFAKHGYDSKMGARPMARLIEKEIRKPLADELLFGQLSESGTVKVGVNKDKIAITIS